MHVILRHLLNSGGVIENVPVVTCPHCGESYLTAQTLHEVERLKRRRQEIAVKRPVAVVDFE